MVKAQDILYPRYTDIKQILLVRDYISFSSIQSQHAMASGRLTLWQHNAGRLR